MPPASSPRRLEIELATHPFQGALGKRVGGVRLQAFLEAGRGPVKVSLRVLQQTQRIVALRRARIRLPGARGGRAGRRDLVRQAAPDLREVRSRLVVQRV